MNCQDCQDRLPDFVSGALSPDEQAEVRDHLASRCSACHEELDRLREAFAMLALTTPPVRPPAHLRSTILARVRGDLAARGDVSPPIDAPGSIWAGRRRAGWRSALPYAAVTLCAVFAGVASVYFADQRVVSREVAEREFQQRMAQAQRLFHSANARSALLSKVGATAADGQLVWDSVAGEVHFYAYNLGLPATDSHFELWFVDEQGKWTSIGSLQPASDGSCSALLRADAGRGDILRAVVTEEPNAAPAVDVAMDRPLGPERMVADFAGSTAK